MRQSMFLCLALLAAALLGSPQIGRAWQPSPMLASSDIAVVQQFFDDINRNDAAAAVALFAPGGTSNGACFCRPAPCTTPAEIERAISIGWIRYRPITVTLTQPAPGVLVEHGQGTVDSGYGSFHETIFGMRAGMIVSQVGNPMGGICVDPDAPQVCIVGATPRVPPRSRRYRDQRLRPAALIRHPPRCRHSKHYPGRRRTNTAPRRCATT
ncbi:MAG TPA: hypothetical protein VFD32_06655 [Dehalococcoidia bacterium]|nr:hypothetical protein [Dehalococcoidia bacterium]